MRARSKARWDDKRGRYRVQVRWTTPDGRIASEERFGEAPGPLDAWADQRRREIDADREAQRVRSRLEAAGRSLPEPSPTRGAGPRPSLRNFVEAFLHWLPTSRAAPGTISTYESALRATVLPTALGDLPLDQITPSQVDFLRSFIVAKGHDPRRPLTALSACLSYAAREGLIQQNPCSRPRGVYRADAADPPRPPPVTLTRAQRQATLEQLPEPTTRARRRYRWMLRLCGWCGLRISEARGVQPGDLDLDRGLLQIRRQLQKARGGDLVRPPKYNSTRVVPLGWQVRDELAEAVQEAARLGVTWLLGETDGRVPGAWLSDGGLQSVVRDAQTAAGVPETIPWRRWRSTFLTLALQYGYPAAIVEQWVGHRGLSGLTDVGRKHYQGEWDPETLDRKGLD